MKQVMCKLFAANLRTSQCSIPLITFLMVTKHQKFRTSKIKKTNLPIKIPLT